jgi:hypothetical protein
MNLLRSLHLALASVVILGAASAAFSQPRQDAPIDAATRAAVIETLVKELNEGYVFPETAAKMGADGTP